MKRAQRRAHVLLWALVSVIWLAALGAGLWAREHTAARLQAAAQAETR